MHTPAGRALLAEVLPGHFDCMEHLSRHLTTEEQETLGTLLKRLGEESQITTCREDKIPSFGLSGRGRLYCAPFVRH